MHRNLCCTTVLLAICSTAQLVFAGGGESPEALVEQLVAAYQKGDHQAFLDCIHTPSAAAKTLGSQEAERAMATARLRKAIGQINSQFGNGTFHESIWKDRDVGALFTRMANRMWNGWIIFENPKSIKIDLKDDTGTAKGTLKVVYKNGRATYAGDFRIRRVEGRWYVDYSGIVILKPRAKKFREQHFKKSKQDLESVSVFLKAFEETAQSVKEREKLDEALAKIITEHLEEQFAAKSSRDADSSSD